MNWDDLNESELVYLAMLVNPNVHRGLGREALIEIIENDDEEPLPERKVDRAREDIFHMVDRYWVQVESLLGCPMKTRNPRACFGCTDIQVAECTLLNKKLIEKVKEDPYG